MITERKELSDQDVLQVFDFAVKNDRKIWWIENREFIEAFTDLTKKEDINFYIQYNDDKYCLQIKIWI